MAEDSHVVRGINWRETFPFTHIFRSFRVAIHPSKMILALVAVLVLYFGGRVLDAVWPGGSRGVPREIDLYEGVRTRVGPTLGADEPPVIRELFDRELKQTIPNFAHLCEQMRNGIQAQYADLLVALRVEVDGVPITAAQAKDAAKGGKYLGRVKDRLIEERDKRVTMLDKRYELEREAARHGDYRDVKAALDAYYSQVEMAEAQQAAAKDAANKSTNIDERAKQKTKADDDYKAAEKKAADQRDEALKNARKNYDARYKEIEATKDAAQKDEALKKDADEKQKNTDEVETSYHNNMLATYGDVERVWRGVQLVDGASLWDLLMNYEAARVNDATRAVLNNNWLGTVTDPGGAGVFYSIYRLAAVPARWGLRVHPVYFTLLLILFLLVWAVFGGAIARIAAVHVAREEKISIRQALRFSAGKFLSYVFAPVIPLAIVLVVGIVVAIGGLVTNLPFLGPILVGALFFLALAAGFVMTLVALGTAGGINLMYPTIAVEGSDSFDAISRSFSYVYARPWRMLWYTMVAIAYGAVTFLFIRLFVYLLLLFTHHAAGAWVFTHANSLAPAWDSMWPRPALWNLTYEIPWLSLGAGQKLGAFFLSFWVYLVVGAMAAFLVSFYFSANTIIYYLMRREVDATELDDVYLEQSDEDQGEAISTAPAAPSAAPATAAPAAAPAATMPSTPAPPAESAPPAGGGEAPPEPPPATGDNNNAGNPPANP